MSTQVNLIIFFVLIFWVYSFEVEARVDSCSLSHEGCTRGCESIENLYYVSQCHGACGTGLAQCRSGN